MSERLELILDDLKVGLRQRAARRRRTRATATVLSSAAMAVVALTSVGSLAEHAPASAGAAGAAGWLVATEDCGQGAACWDLNLPKDRRNAGG